MEFLQEDIEKNVTEWANNFLGKTFEFREHQLETIVDILYNILNGTKHTQIIEAPTGSGKSLINIISACVLAEYYGKESYILCTDLFLWKQYEDFVKHNKKVSNIVGILKGQTGNYECLMNNQDMRNSDCRMAGVSWPVLFNPSTASNLGYSCASKCPYVRERKKALHCKVVIMTYALYHYMINIVSATSSDKRFIFSTRENIFCDECHNIPSIMSMEFRPIIKPSDINFIRTIYNYNSQYEIGGLFGDEDVDNQDLISSKCTWKSLKNEYESILDIALNEHAGTKQDTDCINRMFKFLSSLSSSVEKIEEDLSQKRQVFHEKFDDKDREDYKATSWFRNMSCIWNDFSNCVDAVGIENVIKTVNENRNTGEIITEYSVAKEDYISYYFLLNTAVNRVLLSATVGGYEAFFENVGLTYFDNCDDIDYTVIPSTFDFSNSPINFLNRYKMSYANKYQSFPKIKQAIYKICQSNVCKRGMIQTGSYANALEIYNDAPEEIKSRLLMYTSAKEKTKLITQHQMSNDTILIGPTLVEGIDLPGEQCEFIIIAKVPYPVITDKYTKKKMELFPKWYNSHTSNEIIQGIGRGNRFKDDKCITYILDACFLTLYNATKDQYPEEMQRRIKLYN